MALLIFAAAYPTHAVVRRAVQCALAFLTVAVLCDAALFYRLTFAGRIDPGVPIPLSLFLAIAFGFIFWTSLSPWRLSDYRQRFAFASVLVAICFVFPLAQMFCFGKTDYRRHADAIVVFGARTYGDGTPSFVLADRTRTAVSLYKQGLAPKLIFSGGPGDGATSEPQAMRTLARSMGVPDSAIVLDEYGLNTDATVADTVPIFEQLHCKTVIAVSHFYHLPRVKLAYTRRLSADRANVEIVTVPAVDPRPLRAMPFYIAREVPAIWTYYFRPLFDRA